MKKFLFALVLSTACLSSAVAMADDVTVVTTTTSVEVSGPAADAALASKPIKTVAMPKVKAPAPVPNKGDTTWMLMATVLVIFMSVPGLALFYGGLVRSKNMLSILMQVFSIFSLVSVLWVAYGYSLAFSTNANGAIDPFIGGFSKAFMKGVGIGVNVETFSKGVVIPELLYAMFQLTFAAITCALIVGGFAERMKFSVVMIFTALWFTFAYLPLAHMVWYWGGPSAYNGPSGFLFSKGALDFAGGTVVHINAGVAALVAALIIGKRIGYGKVPMTPHSLTMTLIGAGMLWCGWFGFNAGSNLEANDYAVLAFANTIFATAVAAVTWGVVEWQLKGKSSLLGVVSGAIAGLVGITPACGFVGLAGALVIGISCALACLFAVTWLKSTFGYDDALDAFGIHGIGGIVGAMLTGVFVAPSLGGAGVVDYATDPAGTAPYDLLAQLTSQLWAVGVAIVWSALVTFIILKVLDLVMGIRVSEDAEREGLDLSEHNERAYSV